MDKRQSTSLIVAVLLLLLGLGFLLYRANLPSPDVKVEEPPAAPPPPSVPAEPAAPKPVEPPPPPPKPAVKAPQPDSALPEAAAPTPPTVKLHKELIPKDIAIVRCYYKQEIVPPAVTMEFDINGSGFTAEFQKMISIDPGAPGLKVKNLRLITANQIRGDMEVGPETATTFVFPKVLIKNLPVFSAPEPFAVVRPGEVLAIFFIQMEENGRAGRFRVITNLDDKQAKLFRVEPSTPGLQVTDIEAHLPYAMEGMLRIGQGVPQGEYGLAVFLGSKEISRKEKMIRIVRPTVGQSGFVHGLSAVDPYHRPGDTLQIYVQGTGLNRDDTTTLSAKVDEFDMGKGSFTYVSPAQMRVGFQIPAAAPLGAYGVSVYGKDQQLLHQKKQTFTLVPPNWVAGVQITPPVTPGQKSALKVVGRDFTPDFSQGMRISTDEPGITISSLMAVDASTLAAEIAVSSAVAPGDYLLHLESKGVVIKPQFGSLIKVNNP